MDFVTLATFSTSYDATPYRVNLEHEGIPCFLKDEHTMTTARIYEHAVGGIKLQVPKEDFHRAKQIMKDAGYVFDDIFDLPPFWKWFDRKTRGLPLIGDMSIVFRFVLFLILISILLIIPLYNYITPSTTERLTQNKWCIDDIEFKDKRLKPQIPTPALSFVRQDGYTCAGEMKILDNGNIQLPGFNSKPFWGKWSYSQRVLTISELDTLQDIYGGSYKIKFKGTLLELSSKTTTLHCSQVPPIEISLPF